MMETIKYKKKEKKNVYKMQRIKYQGKGGIANDGGNFIFLKEA